MKKLILILAVVWISLSSTTIPPVDAGPTIITATEFCEGWEDGYCEGWRYVKGRYAICPITPLCPLPELGRDRYRDGYNRGFKAGERTANR